MEEFEYEGKKFRVNDDGTIEVTDELGRKITTGPDGVKLDISTIGAVSIANIVDVAKYDLREVEDLILHEIEFRDGGRVSFAFTTEGKLEKLHSRKIAYHLTPANDIVIYMHSPT